MRPFTVTLVGCYGRFGLNSAEFLGTNSSSSTYTSVAVQFAATPLERGRGSVHMASTQSTSPVH